MTYGPHFAAHLHRLGQEAGVKERTETGKNYFGNQTDDHSTTPDRYVTALRTYPNRNTQVEKPYGDRNRDRPVFMVAIGPNQPAPPEPNDVLTYNGQDYEVKAHTPYDTHVEFFGEPIIHDESGE